MKTFKCEFGEDLSCEIQVTDDPPQPELGVSHIRHMLWSKPPNKEVLKPYMKWMINVHQQLADEWNCTITYVFEVKPGKLNPWFFAPGKRPKRIKL